MSSVRLINHSGQRIYYVAAILAIVIWSSSFISTKIAYTTFPPITLGAVRFIIASFILGVVLIIKKEKVIPTLQDLRIIAVSGFLGITLYFVMENIGLSLTTASNAALIVACYPAITALLERIIYKIKLSKRKIIGILLAIFGVYLLAYVPGAENQESQLLGNIILIATGLAWAFYNFTTRKVANKYPAVTLSFYQTIAGTLCFIPLAFIEKSEWQAPTLLSLSMLIHLGVLCSVIAFLLYNFGLRKLSSSTSVSLMNLVPIFGVIFSMIILGETVTGQQIIGSIIVIGGVFLTIKQGKPD